MEAAVAYCPACLCRGIFCPACGRGTGIYTNGHSKKFVDLRIQTPEQAPERLIEVIQNVSGTVPKETREAAAVELIKRFKYLIQSIVNKLFYGYDLKKYNYDYQDFFQDTLTEFCDLVLHDFRIKENPNGHDSTGLAPFGAYIKTKLYRRVQWRMEEKLESYGWRNKDGRRHNHEVVVDYNSIIDGRSDGSHRTATDNAFYHELNESILSNVLSCDDVVLEEIKDEKIRNILTELIEISRDEKLIPPRDGEIWRMYYLSGKLAAEIGEHVRNYKVEIARTVGQTRIRQVAKTTNVKIIAEFGKRSALRNSGMKI